MYRDLSEGDRRELARRYLDAAEAWMRKIIDRQFSLDFGPSYFTAALPTGNPVISKKVRETAQARMDAEPQRFLRPIDAITFGSATKILLHPDHYVPRFKAALDSAYPDGLTEAHTFLGR